MTKERCSDCWDITVPARVRRLTVLLGLTKPDSGSARILGQNAAKHNAEVRAKHLYEMTLVSEAVKKAFGAQKMNYECLGNGDGGAHIHWHLFPRMTGDIENYGNNGRGPVWWYPRDKMYADDNRPSAEELEELKSKLLCELDKLLM